MNNYICTRFGFIKSITFNNSIKAYNIYYTKRLRYAQAYNSKSAKKLMEKHDIVGWVYNPYVEDHIGHDKYEVIKNKSYRGENNVDEWQVVKACSVNDSDASFLHTKKLKSEDYMSLEEAQAKAIELNFYMVKKLQDILSKQIEDA